MDGIKDQIVKQYKKNLKELKKIGSNIQTEIRKMNVNRNPFMIDIKRENYSTKKRNVLEET